MDTRAKIIAADVAARIARDENIRILCGRFDPLIAEHARRIGEVGQGEPLLVLVLDYADAILPAGARAELVAALQRVRHVCVVDDAVLNTFFGGLSIVRDQEEDVLRQKRLLAHIRRREPQQGGGTAA
jgi:hypothetical protein